MLSSEAQNAVASRGPLYLARGVKEVIDRLFVSRVKQFLLDTFASPPQILGGAPPLLIEWRPEDKSARGNPQPSSPTLKRSRDTPSHDDDNALGYIAKRQRTSAEQCCLRRTIQPLRRAKRVREGGAELDNDAAY